MARADSTEYGYKERLLLEIMKFTNNRHMIKFNYEKKNNYI